ncbi:hypothetical protein [Bacillus sp. SM2101]|uniref:hypothetical protein n=1 Tax=Bacillus sp. SM2101 TaxID=2805366 RepID=UPI001BDEBC6B|nr:hypothetical protein [Bacillus sp. SM2101]
MAIAVLTSCSKEEIIKYEHTFSEEGEYCKAKFITTGTQIWGDEEGQLTYDHERNDNFILEYIGESHQLLQIENLEYIYITSTGKNNSGRTFTEPPTEKIFTSSRSYSGSSKVQENEIIKCYSKMGFEEIFELKNVTE